MTPEPDGISHPEHDPEPVVTRSEEQLRVSTIRRAVARARMVTDIETETVTRTIELRHDQVRLELEPLAADDPDPTSAGGDGHGWLVLYDEEVVITTRRVPRERVRLRVRTVTEEWHIAEALDREEIAVERETNPGLSPHISTRIHQGEPDD